MSLPVGLGPMFAPASIAVVGASSTPNKAGAAAMDALSGFAGALYPVNPRPGVIAGRPAVASVAAIGAPVDLAVLVVPPAAVPGALADCAKGGVRAAVLCAGGFAEAGPAGAALQAEAAAIAATHGIRLLGPNTSGFVNPVDGVLATFVPTVAELPAGPAAIVAQSGGVNLALCFLAAGDGLGIRLGVGLGNAVDVGFADVLDHLADDADTRAVALHVEGVADGRALTAAVARVTARKPLVALKVGRADVSDFARSHTGALTGNFALTRAALTQAGAVVVDDPTELIDALRALSARRMPPRRRPGVGVVTGQAGPGLIIADLLRAADVSLPELSPATTASLDVLLPPLTYQRNPVDTGRPAETFADVLVAVARDPAIDALAVYALDEPDALDPAAALRAVPEAADVVTVFGTGGLSSTLDSRQAAVGAGFAFYRSPDRLARAVAALVADSAARWRRKDPARPAPEAGELEPGPLDEDAAKRLLAAAGLRTPERMVCASWAEAEAALAALGAPVVVKILDPTVTHKSDVGGVHANVASTVDLHAALARIDAIEGSARRYLVEAQAPPGVELIVGGLRDPAFGPVVLLAPGGVAVELAREPILRLAPLSRADAEEMVAALPAGLLAGYRGAPAVDVDAVAGTILAVADVLTGFVDIAELDVNPVRLTADGPIALDALVVRTSKDLEEQHMEERHKEEVLG